MVPSVVFLDVIHINVSESIAASMFRVVDEEEASRVNWVVRYIGIAGYLQHM
jgi:hypothetical protein